MLLMFPQRNSRCHWHGMSFGWGMGPYKSTMKWCDGQFLPTDWENKKDTYSHIVYSSLHHIWVDLPLKNVIIYFLVILRMTVSSLQPRAETLWGALSEVWPSATWATWAAWATWATWATWSRRSTAAPPVARRCASTLARVNGSKVSGCNLGPGVDSVEGRGSQWNNGPFICMLWGNHWEIIGILWNLMGKSLGYYGIDHLQPTRWWWVPSWELQSGFVAPITRLYGRYNYSWMGL